MKVKDIRAQSSDDLRLKMESLKKELFDLKYQRKIGRVERPSMFQSIKKDIARILTILNEREKDGNKTK